MIDASLNEVESTAAKAARGGGLDWGLCDEVARAARWLAACGLDWAPGLMALIEAHPRLSAPASFDGRRLKPARPGGTISPLLAGPYLCDLGRTAQMVDLGPTAYPMWLLPFAGAAAAITGGSVVVGWNGLSILAWPHGADHSGRIEALTARSCDQMTWLHEPAGFVAAEHFTSFARACRSAVTPADWEALGRLGARTYVPASALSRARGAGSGLVDHD